MRNIKNSNPYLIGSLGAAILLALVIAFFFPRKAFSNCPSFPVNTYLSGDSVWTSSDYVISGSFQNILSKKKDSEAIVCSIVTDEGKVPLPVILLPNSCKTPLQKEQRVRAKARVQDDGRILVSECVIQ
jgi:hypothetical protein